MDGKQLAAMHAALEECGVSVRSRSGMRWDLELPNGKVLDVVAEFRDGWLVLRAPVPLTASQVGAWELLRFNGQLRMPGKVLAPEADRRRLLVGSETALGDTLPSRVERACVALGAACAALEDYEPTAKDGVGASGASAETDAVPPDAGAMSHRDDPHWPDDVERWLTAEGRSPRRRPDGRLTVRLGTTDAFREATIHPTASGVRIVTDLIVGSVLHADCREALGTFLLAASGQLRLLRGAAERRESQDAAMFEVVLASPFDRSDVHHALASLTIACDAFGREATALTGASLARTYLTHTQQRG